MQINRDSIIIFIICTTIVILLLATLIISLAYFYRKKQLAYFKNLEEIRMDYEKNIMQAQLEMQENTFQHISREIHDNISLALTLAKLKLNTLDWTNLILANKQIDSSLEQISKAIDDLSDISKSLNSELIINQGLIRALEKEMNKIKDANLFQLKYKVTGDLVFMESQKELVIFRIVQEAFNNIIKHAKASSVELNLHYSTDHINVSISDNGKGFCKNTLEKNIEKDSKAGLNNMQKRAAMFNGKTIINSEPGGGTSILVTIPY